MSRTLLLHLRSELKRAADPSKAPQMQKYMKSAMPYHGVPGPVLRQVFKEVFASLSFSDADSWRDTVLYIWHNARFRRSEEHTSELQSRPHLVCRLLLEKKKKN